MTNPISLNYAARKTVCQLFQEQVEKTPNSIAIEYEGQSLTYQELNEYSNQLARYIRHLYQQRTQNELLADTLIGLCLDRSLEMLVGIMGVIKAGAAYVPIDPDYPQERIDHILEDTKVELVLSQKPLIQKGKIRLPQNKIVTIDLSESPYLKEESSNLLPYSEAKNLVYVIYTSGTSGKPKGVLVTHEGLVNLIYVQKNKLGIDASARVLQHASYVFDVSVWEIFSSLSFGANLFISPASIKQDANLVRDYIEHYEINIATMTPALLSVMEYKKLPKLSILMLAGEPCSSKVMSQWCKGRTLINAYGPTENSVCATMHSYEEGDLNTNIGRPIDNVSAYVLDSKKSPVPNGAIGELYLGGVGVANGYLNRRELTQKYFITNPFASDRDKANGHTRLYKTGDLVRCWADGNLQYVGRSDDQVKIRGYRIELVEIEKNLEQISGITQSCVIAKEREAELGSIKHLVAYYVTGNKSHAVVNGEVDQTRMTTITTDKIVKELSKILPAYMIPDFFIPMSSFPLTFNGKIDKRSLPEPDFRSMVAEYIPPTTDIEKELCKIWEEAIDLEKVGITDDFFSIGGTSILAMHVSHKMTQFLGHDVKVVDIFRHKNIVKILQCKTERIQIPKAKVESAILSFAQERLWFLEQYEKGTNTHHLPIIFELATDIDIKGVKYALQKIVSRHEILRSKILQHTEKGFGIQVVCSQPLIIEEITLPSKNDCSLTIKNDLNYPFDLSQEYPIRAKFYRVSECSQKKKNNIILAINIHHIAADGWSLNIIQRELFRYYEAYINNNIADFSLPPLDIQYKDYALWQRDYLTKKNLEPQLNYWKDKLSGYQPLALTTDYLRPDTIAYEGLTEFFTLDEKLSQALRFLAKCQSVTLNTVLLSAFNVLLGKYTGQDDIVIGSPIAGRHHRQTESLIGFFVNTQVKRTYLDKSQSFEDLIQQVHQDQIDSQLNQDLPFEILVDALKVKRDTSRHPIFQVMFGMQEFGHQTQTEKRYFNLLSTTVTDKMLMFDLAFFVDTTQKALRVQIDFATNLYSKNTIVTFFRHFKYLLAQLTEDPQRPHSKHSLLNQEEYDLVIKQWNANSVDRSSNQVIHKIFQEQVEKLPDNTAITYEGKSLTYRELNEKSNQLARYIREQYQQRTKSVLTANTLIGLCLDRSLEMVIGMLGVIKAGGAYVPIDSNYPQKRVDYILEDTNTSLILSQIHLIEGGVIQFSPNKAIAIDLLENLYQQEDSSDITVHSKAEDLVYVIYTSGTSGRPKGVQITHKGLTNLVTAQSKQFQIKPKSKVLQHASYVFDASVCEMFNALSCGAELFILPENTRKDAGLVSGYLESNQINIAALPPVLLGEMEYKKLPSLHTLIVSGEPCSSQVMNQWSTNRKLINAYGPTENSVCATMHEYQEGDLNTNIGRPIDNVSVYVLDSNRIPVPIGVAGELYISGAGIARGYLNRPDLMKKCFVTNPFSTEKDKVEDYTIMYKTGDLVRWLTDGTLEYIGRNDDRVKIRGYRIELGEIEHTLDKIPGIAQSCVLVQERKTKTTIIKYLVAYYTVDRTYDDLVNKAIILNTLSDVLPEYMIPNIVIEIDSFPLTINGKLDKSTLPDPDYYWISEGYVKPTTVIEIELCNIWKNELELEKIGITDDFFQMGGNSIIAVRVVCQMNEVLRSSVKIADLFRLKSINNIITKLGEYNKMIKLYHADYDAKLTNLVLIHPAAEDSHMYQSLVARLRKKYNCVGIDNYNLHRKDKIHSLNEVANYYLSEYEKNYSLDEPINLLGWSLGGKIALEMAAILESLNYTNVHVFLLDSFIGDETIWSFENEVVKGLGGLYKFLYGEDSKDKNLETIISTRDVDIQMLKAPLLRHLKHTSVTLFKAVLLGEREPNTNKEMKLLDEHMLNLAANNIDLVANQVDVINLECCHEDILEKCENFISEYLNKYQQKLSSISVN